MNHPLCLQEQSNVDVILKHYQAQLVYRVTMPGQPAFVALPGANWFEVFTKLVASLWAVFQNKGSTTDVKAAITEAVLEFYHKTIEPLLQARFGLLYRFVQGSVEGLITEAVGGIVDGLFKVAAGPATQPVAGGSAAWPQTPGGFTPY